MVLSYEVNPLDTKIHREVALPMLFRGN